MCMYTCVYVYMYVYVRVNMCKLGLNHWVVIEVAQVQACVAPALHTAGCGTPSGENT